MGVVDVPDARLNVLGEMFKSKKIVPAAMRFVDIAGLVKGASKGEGLGNKFLAHIREVDAVAQVVRCFEDGNITHVEGSINPLRDIEIINTELCLADMETVEKRQERLVKLLKTGDKKVPVEKAVLDKVMEGLGEAVPARRLGLTDEEKEFLTELHLLTMKPVLYVANVAEDEVAAPENNPHVQAVMKYAEEEGAETIVVSAKMESEIAELPEDEAKEFLEMAGLEEAGLDRLIKAGFKLLGLMTYLTAGETESRAWTIKRGTKAPQAAGKIHSDFERGFIRDEDINPTPPSWKDRMVVGDLYTGFAVFVTAAVFLLFGIMFAKIFLSGPTTVQNGLQGVVINSEVPRGRARCGVAEKTQGCVLYIMNPQRQDLNGRDFYDLAAQLTGRQRFMIETGNMRYSSIKIKPGEIAQLNIPPLQ